MLGILPSLVLPVMLGLVEGYSPIWAVAVLVGVLFTVIGYDWIPETAPLKTLLPQMVLCLVLGWVVLAALASPPWNRHLSVVLVILTAGLALMTRPHRVAWTTLGCLGLIAVGAKMTVYSFTDSSGGGVVTGLISIWALLAGLCFLSFRQELFRVGGHDWRAPSLGWARSGGIALLAVAASAGLLANGWGATAILVMLAGLSWGGFTTVITFGGPDAVQGALLMLCGPSVTALGTVAFFADDPVAPIAGYAAISIGTAITGGALVLLESSGVLPRIRALLINLVTPRKS